MPAGCGCRSSRPDTVGREACLWTNFSPSNPACYETLYRASGADYFARPEQRKGDIRLIGSILPIFYVKIIYKVTF
jgi:hypothetical protein